MSKEMDTRNNCESSELLSGVRREEGTTQPPGGRAQADPHSQALAGGCHPHTGRTIFPGGWSHSPGAPGTGQNV